MLLVVGFGLKAGLVPLHVWMPLAHAAAPMPASAVLSGVVVKAGIIGLIRFLPSTPRWLTGATCLRSPACSRRCTPWRSHHAITSEGCPGVLERQPDGIYRSRDRHGRRDLDAATPVLAAFYATHHILVKGAMFCW